MIEESRNDFAKGSPPAGSLWFYLVTQQEIQQVRNRLNHRSRKCLGFKTLAKMFQQLSGINYNLATGSAL